MRAGGSLEVGRRRISPMVETTGARRFLGARSAPSTTFRRKPSGLRGDSFIYPNPMCT